ncbi:MAG: hypothetical protein V1685_02950 [Parcubacteria group bacterium]
MPENIFASAARYLVVEILWDIVYFPIWWYSKGLVGVGRYCLSSASFHLQRRLALGIWLRSMLKPMFGDYTKEGRIISFFMRIIVMVWKLVVAVVWLVILLVLFFAWVCLPLLIIYFIAYQVFGVSFVFFP